MENIGAGSLAFVSGGTSGIGAAFATQLAARGVEVIVSGRDRAKGEAFAATLGPGHRYVQFDVSSEKDWEQALADAVGDRHLDILALNAGISSRFAGTTDPMEVLDPAEIDRVLGINFGGIVIGLRAAMPWLRGEKPAHVLVNSSTAGLVPYTPDPIYTASKMAAIGLVRAFAPTLAAENVILGAVCPGSTDTPLIPDEFKKRLPNGDIVSLRTGNRLQVERPRGRGDG